MAVIKKVIAKKGTYTDHNGNEKNSYMQCGVLIQNNDGDLSVKLEGLPTSFDGWLSMWDMEPRGGNNQSNRQPNSQPDNQSIDEKIPF